MGAGRDALVQLRAGRKSADGANRVKFGPEALDGLSALATHGFRPDRLDMYLNNGIVYVTASHALPVGRWLNVDLVFSGAGKGFPQTRMTIGSLPLSAYWSRRLMELGRWMLRMRGADIPPFDQLVQDFAVQPAAVVATVRLPARSGLVDQLAGQDGRVDGAQVLRIYCRLTDLNRPDPQPLFATHVRRAFGEVSSSNVAGNRAAFIALAMFVVDRKVGQLANLSDDEINRCDPQPTLITLHGRADLPKHWSLSAALAARTDGQLAEAAGEWKELADTLSRRSEFEKGDPTGFSFVDLAADRAGFRIAQIAVSEASANRIARRLSGVTEAQLLPPALLTYSEGLKGEDFVAAYGSIDDPRYLRVRGVIDDALDGSELVAP